MALRRKKSIRRNAWLGDFTSLLPASGTASRWATAVVAPALLLGGMGQAQVARTIINTSFETPTIALACQGYVYEARVPGWKTADTLLTNATTAGFDNPNGCVGSNGTMPASGTRVFEFYSNGVRDNQSSLYINARDGQQFVELSAETASRLYQPMCLIPGETVGFKFSHLGRMSSTVQDVAAFYVGGTSALKSGTKIVQFGDTTSGTGAVTSALSTNTTAARGSLAYSGTTRYWYDYSGSFVVPSGLGGLQNLSFEAVSNSTGNTAYGNFMDAVQVTLNPFVEFVGSTTSALESSGSASLPQIRVVGVVPAGGITVAVNVRVAGTTATSPSDYTGVANITIPAVTYDGGTGSLFRIPLTIVNDAVAEPTEQIVFDLATGAGYSVANTMNCGVSATASATHTIIDDDISGTVYEDYNYGGGAGRVYNASQGMSLRPNARVELYNSAGTFVTSTTTDANGVYSFSGLAAGSYTVRVVNSTVTSSRTGYVSGLLPVQTYANGSRVGGEAPAKVDAAAGASGSTLSGLTTTTVAPESIASVTVGGSATPTADFGFNFDTVVNTKPSGQGSLAQFITNSNALKNTGLAQDGSRSRDGVTESLPAATETSIFMIPTSALTSGVSVITMPDGATSTTSVLPAVTDTFTSIDGTTQTVNIGETNTGLVGTGGTVGYLTTATLTQVPRPEVQIQGPGRSNTSTTAGFGLVLNANNSTVRGISIFGFGAHNDSQGAVSVNTANDSLLEQNLFGMAATSAMCTSSTTATGVGSGVFAQSSLRGTLQHNILSCNGGNGAHIYSGTSAWTIVNNEFRANAMNTGNLDGLDLSSGSSGNTVRGNLFIDNHANGIDSYAGGGSNTYESNTVKNNGMIGDGNNEIPGIRIYSKNNVIRYNLIQDNYGSGILVVNSAVGNTSNYLTGNLISKNSISGNGTIKSKYGTGPSNQIGIDLLTSGDTNADTLGVAPFVTPNDLGDGDVGGNNVMNFPVFDTAVSDGTNAYITGWARPGSTIELFITESPADPGGFGEGKTYLTTLTEGSTADTDAGVSTYTNRTIASIGGVATQTGTDNTSRFRFVLPLSSLPGVSVGTALSSTATDASNNTSEFSPWVLLAAKPNVTLTKYVRNTSVSGQKFSTSRANGLPGQVLQYCIAFQNTGGFAPNFKLQDNIPANTNVLAGSLLYSSPATDLSVLSASPASSTLSANAALTQSGTGPMVYTTNASGVAPATGLAAGDSGVVCFNATIK